MDSAVLQDGLKYLPYLRLNVLKCLGSINHSEPVRCSFRLRQIAYPDTFEEFDRLALKAIKYPTVIGALQTQFNRDVQEQCQVGSELPLYPLLKLLNAIC